MSWVEFQVPVLTLKVDPIPVSPEIIGRVEFIGAALATESVPEPTTSAKIIADTFAFILKF